MLLSYKDRYIYIKPDSDDESKKIFDILNNCDMFIKRRAELLSRGDYKVTVSMLPILNKALLPLKSAIRQDDDFKDFIAAYKEQRIKNGKNKVSGLVIVRGVTECRIIGKKSLVPTEEISKKTRYFFEGAKNSKKYKNGVWDGYIYLYNKYKRTFPSGLLHIVEEVLRKHKVPYRVDTEFDEAPKKQFNWVVNDGITPDPDQVEAVKAGLLGKRGIMKAPTGFGKTAILAKRLTVGFGVPTLFIANKKALLDDAAEEFMSGIKGLSGVGQIKDGIFDTTAVIEIDGQVILPEIKSPVIVATIQSLAARLEDEKTSAPLRHWLNNVCKFVMVDECQAVGTKTWDTVLNECRAPYRILLSATPWRTDGATLSLTAASGPTLYSTTAEEQIEKGRLCDLDIYYHKFDHELYNDRDTAIPYSEAYAEFIAGNEKRNAEIVKLALSLVEEERLTLVFVTSIDHGYILKDMFIKAGLSPDDIRFIFGGTKNKERRAGIQDFKEGKFKILIGSTIFDAGVNIPAISGAVVAGAGNADITIIQKIGRAARNCDYEKVLGYTPKFLQGSGRKCSVIYDILDINVCFFRRQSKNRYYTLRKEYGPDRVHFVNGATASDFRMPKKAEIEANEIKEALSADDFVAKYKEFIKNPL